MNDNNKPLTIIAWGFSIGFGLIGLGFLLKWTLPALGAMIGIASAISSGDMAANNSNSWIPLAAVGLAVAGGSGGIMLLAKVVKEAEKNLYEWTLPILAIISGLVIDTCKELYQGNQSAQNDPVVRLGYAASVTGLFLLAGILWKQEKIKFKWIDTKMISAFVFLIPPFMIYLKYCEHVRKTLWSGYQNIPSHILGAISILMVFSLLIGFLSWVFKHDHKESNIR
ncbi:hypothetical protein [Flavobacterium sp.]|uniref:hypothetical protein n=1 Tax=Flavobacterium sp. TaxID=239 RepID=UPI002615FAEA|nr:hypothetical protein [Flavobacterium sp.]